MKCDACLKDIPETGNNIGYAIDLPQGCTQVYPAGKYFICFDCVLAGCGVSLSAAQLSKGAGEPGAIDIGRVTLDGEEINPRIVQNGNCVEMDLGEACPVPVQEVHAAECNGDAAAEIARLRAELDALKAARLQLIQDGLTALSPLPRQGFTP